jgi:predicted O-methyltransferase YrrM
MTYIPMTEPESSIDDQGAQWLYERATKMDSVVEIGSFKGKSTHALLSGCKGTVTAVDHFKGSPDPADYTLNKSGKLDFLKNVGLFPNLHLLEMSSAEASKLFLPKSVDMVFIDGCHLFEDVKNDLECWMPIIRKLISGHDSGWPGVIRAIEYMGFKTLSGPNSIWYVEVE